MGDLSTGVDTQLAIEHLICTAERRTFMREYAKSWDVRKIQDLGYQVDPNFLDDLRKASGRKK
jgi:hypothetical protein